MPSKRPQAVPPVAWPREAQARQGAAIKKGPTLKKMRSVLGAVAASCIVAVAILLLSWTTYFAELNSTAYDFALRLAGPVSPSSPTTIVAIDEDSLAQIGVWPWSREKLALLIQRVSAGKPRAIALDILLDDRTTEQADNALAIAIANGPPVVLAMRRDSVNGVERWLKPLDRFAQKGVRLGHVHTDPDFDSISRRIFYAKTGEGLVVPAFAVQTLHAAGLSFKSDFEQKQGAAAVIRPQPVNIRFVGDEHSFPHVPAWKILVGSLDPAQFKNQIVLIGFTAEGLGDNWLTPFAETGKKMSGVEVHANVIDTLYAGRAIAELPDLVLLLALAAFLMLLWWLNRQYEGRRFYAAAIATGPALLALSWFLMKYFHLWFPFPPFWAAIVVVVPGLEIANRGRVIRDLDRKIERLSDGWTAAIRSFESQSRAAAERRERLFGRARRNSRWRLDAIDFFNEELMRFLALNNAILASIEDIIIVSDSLGRVVYQNPAAKRLEKYQDIPYKAADYVASLLDYRDLRPQFESVLEKMEPVTLNFIPAPDERRFYNLTISPIAPSKVAADMAAALGVVVSMHDSTAQFELNQAKSDMVSLVSHELRTPLTSIRGYSDMLLKYNLVQEKGKAFLGTIIDESNRLSQLIQSFLDIASIESGRHKITKSDFELAPLLTDMVTVIEPVAAEKQITVDAADVNGIQVHADRLLLYQALTNLVTNAIKYSPSGTTVRIRVANGDGRVRFQVADQGFGIPADEASKIFEKFYRRTNKETRDQSGFGLGLAFVKEVATRHGGDILVESEVGQGAVFTLWIPN
jgi:signal transduction histidine kinase/CHASE2 domain-containing sensor protein